MVATLQLLTFSEKIAGTMKKNPVLAIVGATGLVGSEMLNIINDKRLALGGIKLLASSDSAGEIYSALGEEVAVEVLDEDSFAGVDLALFATSAELSAKFAPIAAEAGAIVVDNSSFFRMKDDVPLVVPEVNFDSIKLDSIMREGKIIANPNCSTIQLMPILNAIHNAAGLERVVVSTYQSVSGAGKAALDELWGQTIAVCNQGKIETECFQHQIAFNLIPQIDVILEDGYTKEEYKIINESRKILGIPDLRITATAVRVPVFHAHSESVNVETKSELSPAKLREILSALPEISLYDEDYPMPLDVTGDDAIHVGRIRQDRSVKYGLDLWVVADNVRKGAALNAVQIIEKLMRTI